MNREAAEDLADGLLAMPEEAAIELAKWIDIHTDSVKRDPNDKQLALAARSVVVLVLRLHLPGAPDERE